MGQDKKNKNNQYQRRQQAKRLAAKPGKHGKKPPIEDKLNEQHYEIDYFHFHQSLYRKELDEWQAARVARYDPYNPTTYQIQQLYKDSMLDNHLYSCVRDRRLAVINKQFLIKDPNGNVDVDRSKYIKKKWFKKIIKEAINSHFYEYSTILIQDAVYGEIRKVKLIPRENVIPNTRVILKNPMDTLGEKIYIDDYPNFLIHIEMSDSEAGEFERIAPMTIFKRHSWANWDEFEQIFGVPIRIAKTMINTQKHKDDLQEWLEAMGTGAYAIFDKRVDLEIKESKQTDAYEVFDKKIDRVNKEISKSVVGQTMTKDDGSSRSQGEVHQEILQEIIDADIADVEEWVTDHFFDVMRAWGYDIPEGYYLDIVASSSLNPEVKIEIDKVLLENGYNLDNDYVEATYETKLDKNNPRTIAQQTSPGELGFLV